jgi:ADP-ribose pyrophosphatase YjhB (NUDIX family)
VVHYENPKLIVGCVPQWQGKILLCKRAIEPRLGYWTFPAGFMENGETLQQAAARESLEEAQARVQIDSLITIVHVVHAHQVHVMFRGTLLDPEIGAGLESLEVGLYEEHEIPWADIAFHTVEFTLRRYFEDRRNGGTGFHFHDI